MCIVLNDYKGLLVTSILLNKLLVRNLFSLKGPLKDQILVFNKMCQKSKNHEICHKYQKIDDI